MAPTFTSSALTATADGGFVTEASDLGFRATDYLPDTLRIDGVPYHYRRSIPAADEVGAWLYTNNDGRSLTIFND